MSKCVTFTSDQLDILLIPSDIANLSFEQQLKIVLSPSKKILRTQVTGLWVAMIKADKNIKRGSCANGFKVTWNAVGGKIFIKGKSLSNYYNRYLSANNCGFSGLLYKIIEFRYRQDNVKNQKRNGKFCITKSNTPNHSLCSRKFRQ